ncbi:MAG: hypothetical protein HQK92_02350 [Nitrospirae bacterium]|nr:hypothetical protein [Nitrospirota bacterium]
MESDISIYMIRLSEIFSAIDADYKAAQDHYGGFTCSGCSDNCCTTVFNHYTLLEYFYLSEGLSKITDQALLKVIFMRAEMYFKEVAKNPFNMESLRIMCPLNFNDKCIVYENRPLICRSHGVPSVLKVNTAPKQQWPGCNRFKENYAKDADGTFNPDFYFDRTSHYSMLAALEKQLRIEFTFFQKIKKTVAEMVLDYFNEEMIDISTCGCSKTTTTAQGENSL